MKKSAVHWLSLLCASISSIPAYADGIDPIGRKLDWHTEQVDDVIALFKFGQKTTVQGNECVSSAFLNFKINDELAFDIDEPVELNIEVQLQPAASRLIVMHDGNGVFPSTEPPRFIDLPADPSGRLYRQTVTLDRTRFANLGFQGSDISITAERPFTLCGLTVKRSYTTPVPKAFGWVDLKVVDETDRKTPVRVGLYDETGRTPLPNDEAVPIRNGAQGITRISELGGYGRDIPAWPQANRSVFYIDGAYHARLAPGTYEMIVAKGPEYRLSRQKFTIAPDATSTVNVKLQRWADMAAKGWYSGDSHFHYARNSAYDDRNLQLFLEAEDVRVASDLQMGNIEKVYLNQYSWDPILFGADNRYALVIGQEDPRTSVLGHVAELNIRKPFRNPPHYLLYNEGMERARAGGGVVGYAHAISPERDCPADITHSDVARGMAIDVPAGLVDYMEIMSVNCLGDSLWFDFLNLGYKIAPAAGTDYPVGPVLGGMRTYVKVDGQFRPQGWFDGLKDGRSFVTTGPVLSFAINGQEMGSTLRLRAGAPIVIQARAALNPDFGPLSSLELVEQGAIVKTAAATSGAQELALDYKAAARHGTWFVIRARGAKTGMLAWSAPIYISVDGQRTWKRDAVPQIAATLKERMAGVLTEKAPDMNAVEPFDSQATMVRYWAGQQAALKDRVRKANAAYDTLVKEAARSR